jgi:hypothetical protein
MLKDMGQIGSAFEALEKPTGFPHAAAMFKEGWNPKFESFVETG